MSEEAVGFTIDELAVGQQASWSKTLTESDVYTFAGVTGDLNPLHVDAVYAAKSRFGERVVHGMLVASLISTVQATKLPGPGNIYVAQSLSFLAPVHLGDTVTAVVEVTSLDHERNRAVLSTRCVNQDGVVVVDGESEVAPRRVPREGKETNR